MLRPRSPHRPPPRFGKAGFRSWWRPTVVEGTTMSTDNDSADKYDGSIDADRHDAAKAIATADLREAATFTRASKLPRGDSATGSLESRLEAAIKQIGRAHV